MKKTLKRTLSLDTVDVNLDRHSYDGETINGLVTQTEAPERKRRSNRGNKDCIFSLSQDHANAKHDPTGGISESTSNSYAVPSPTATVNSCSEQTELIKNLKAQVESLQSVVSTLTTQINCFVVICWSC